MTVAGLPIADPERAFVEHLPTIDRVIAIIVRRNAVSAADADEFASWVRARIVDSGYAIFQKFAGRSSISTYLSVVLNNLFLDYRNSTWGRWRPSAAATRLGPIGVRLEELLLRDGATLREAIEVLRSAGVPETDVEIGRMSRQLPLRPQASEVPLTVLDSMTEAVVSSPLADSESNDADKLALRIAIEALTPEEQVIMRMRFWDDMSVADIARVLRLEQKPFYRRIESIEVKLRAMLIERGLDRERAHELLTSEAAW